MLATKLKSATREIVYRTDGSTHGPITRLVSPSDLGEVMKPFVFLDLARFDASSDPTPMEYLWHPHSGIATVTVPLAGGIEWMRAGHGVWHTGQVEPGGARAFQLWVALPPELENAPSASLYVQPAQVPAVGPARVILGSYGGAQSPVDAPPMTYLQV